MPFVRLFAIAGSALAWNLLDTRGPTPAETTWECPRTYTVLDARPISSLRPMTRRDLIGKTLREIRHAGEEQWDAVEVAYGAERFTVRFDVTPSASPPVKGLSWKGSKAPGVDWTKRHAGGEIGETAIYDGPLAELALSPDPCR
ncbi:hypothetical protein U8607_22630 [Methylobacterium durans]|uniref:hypothetical protein n=1 Tax=Methylobacterium durans TaxID=2202825 RepID=UPI002AFFC3EF|nr:hypothetical protein [Methylobacterium durans]MEA1834894.1 hypothetical protein [Methylobacterium durans]